jgi:hypothetical protein
VPPSAQGVADQSSIGGRLEITGACNRTHTFASDVEAPGTDEWRGKCLSLQWLHAREACHHRSLTRVRPDRLFIPLPPNDNVMLGTTVRLSASRHTPWSFGIVTTIGCRPTHRIDLL